MSPNLTSIIGKSSYYIPQDPTTTFPLGAFENDIFHDIAYFPSATNLKITPSIPLPDVTITIKNDSIDFYGEYSGAFQNIWKWKNHDTETLKTTNDPNQVEINNSNIYLYSPDSNRYIPINFTVTGTENNPDTGVGNFSVNITKYILNDWDRNKTTLLNIIQNQKGT